MSHGMWVKSSQGAGFPVSGLRAMRTTEMIGVNVSL